MKTILLLLTALFYSSALLFAQTAESKTDTTNNEYILVEGRSETGAPKNLEGTWVLVSGVKKTTPFKTEQLTTASEGRDSVITTTTTDGKTSTTTTVEINRKEIPAKQITPTQKERMHQPENPSISFYGLNETFSGFTGCNKYSGRYTIKENKIDLAKATASTKMVCLGEYDEADFLEKLKQVNTFRTRSEKLELLSGEEVLLVFSKK